MPLYLLQPACIYLLRGQPCYLPYAAAWPVDTIDSTYTLQPAVPICCNAPTNDLLPVISGLFGKRNGAVEPVNSLDSSDIYSIILCVKKWFRRPYLMPS